LRGRRVQSPESRDQRWEAGRRQKREARSENEAERMQGRMQSANCEMQIAGRNWMSGGKREKWEVSLIMAE
jgi:hypothetical protein